MAAPSSSASDETTSAMQIERPLGPPGKLTSWDLFKSMGSPRFVVAVRTIYVYIEEDLEG